MKITVHKRMEKQTNNSNDLQIMIQALPVSGISLLSTNTAVLTCLGHGAPQQVQFVQRKRMQHLHCNPLLQMSQSMVYFLWKHTSPWLPFPKPAQVMSLTSNYKQRKIKV